MPFGQCPQDRNKAKKARKREEDHERRKKKEGEEGREGGRKEEEEKERRREELTFQGVKLKNRTPSSSQSKKYLYLFTVSPGILS